MSADWVEDQATSKQLREVREKARREAAFSASESAQRRQDEGLLYGDRDQQLFPQLQQHLEEAKSLYPIQERPFQSNIPLLGRLIAWFRERWNSISTKWYVRPIIEQQTRFNLTVLQALQDLHHVYQLSSLDMVHRMDALFRSNQQDCAALAARLGDMGASLSTTHQAAVEYLQAELSKQYAELSRQCADVRAAISQGLAGIENKVQQVAHEQQVDRQGQAFQRIKLDRMMRTVDALPNLPAEAQDRLQAERESMLDHDYYRFEDLYRNEAEVREKQLIYLPYFEGRQEVLDIGCGKGEFLELLRDHGIEAYGVDLNEQMVHMCEKKGLRALQGDVLQHLAGLPDNSLGGLFAAHLVEHLSPRALTDLCQLAQTKLQAGAYMILETPNPLCLWALVNYFYLDMSHVKPVHPQALTFLLENCGFGEIETRYLHPIQEGVRLALLPQVEGTPWKETVALLNTNLERLNALLYGFADYAIIAKK